MPNNAIRLLSGSEVARELSISESRVRQLAEAGAIPAIRTNLGRLYQAEDVATLARQRRASAGAQAVPDAAQ
jgi:excisionase family DNA binding protein